MRPRRSSHSVASTTAVEGDYKCAVLGLVATLAAGTIVWAVLMHDARPSDLPTALSTPLAGVHYWSWDNLEFDKCAGVWLIERFVDSRAEFVWYARGTTDRCGTPFDVPGARWMRTARQCTTECVLESTGLQDAALARIAGIARVSELGRWHLDSDPEARRHYEAIQKIIAEYPDPAACLERTNAYFDRLYEELKAQYADDGRANAERTERDSTGDGP